MKIWKYFTAAMTLACVGAAVQAQMRQQGPVRATKPVSAGERDLRSILKQAPVREVPPRQLSQDERRELREQLSQDRRESRGRR